TALALGSSVLPSKSVERGYLKMSESVFILPFQSTPVFLKQTRFRPGTRRTRRVRREKRRLNNISVSCLPLFRCDFIPRARARGSQERMDRIIRSNSSQVTAAIALFGLALVARRPGRALVRNLYLSTRLG